MNTTPNQNQAHHTDIAWIKSKGKRFYAEINGNAEAFISEYVNPWNGMAIRKSWRMTGRDWCIFDAAGKYVTSSHSLTFAKFAAAER